MHYGVLPKMKTLITIFLVLLSNLSFAHQDSVELPSKITIKTRKGSITFYYSRETSTEVITAPLKNAGVTTSSVRVIAKVEVLWMGRIYTIPREELIGLRDVQVRTAIFRYGRYHDGKKYLRIDTLLGEHDVRIVEGYKSMSLFFEEKYKERTISKRVRKSESHISSVKISKKKVGEKEHFYKK